MARVCINNFYFQMVFLFCLLLSGCSVDSEAPLKGYDHHIADKNILGVWSSKDGNFVSTVLDKGGGKYEAVCVLKENDNVDVLRYHVYISHLEGESYANLQQIKEDGDKKGMFNFIRYDLRNNNALSISLPDVDVFKEAIKSGVLRGEAGFFVFLTEKSDKIENFINSNENSFSSKRDFTLYRMKPVQN